MTKIKISKNIYVWSCMISVISLLVMMVDFVTLHAKFLPFSPYENKVQVIFLAIGIYFVMRGDSEQNYARLSYFKLFYKGVLLSIISGILWGGLSFFYVSVINPTYVNTMLVESSRNLSASATAAESVGTRLMAELVYEPSGQLIFKIIDSFIIGIVFSLIVAFILKKQNLKYYL